MCLIFSKASIYQCKWKIRSAKQSTDIIPVVFYAVKIVQLLVEIVFYAEIEQRKKMHLFNVFPWGKPLFLAIKILFHISNSEL